MEEKILEFLKKQTNVTDIQPESRLLDDGILDSLQLIQLIMFIEKDLNVKVDQSKLSPENFATVTKVVEMVQLQT